MEPNDSESAELASERRAALLAAEVTYHVITRPWLQTLRPPQDRKMCRLLMQILIGELKKRPVSKTDARKHIGINDKKIVRKYVQRAVQLGFIQTSKDPNDRKTHQLLPTQKLVDAARMEFFAMARLVHPPAPHKRPEPYIHYKPIDQDDADRYDRQRWQLVMQPSPDEKNKEPPKRSAALRVPA